MNKHLRAVCTEIEKEQELDRNLPVFINHLVNLYSQYAEVKFTIHYYTFYEYFAETFPSGFEEEESLKEFNELLKEYFLDGEAGSKTEEGIVKLNALRNSCIKKMQVLTAYTDIFQVYEYVLNRIEYRFKDAGEEPSREEFVKKALAYIFDTKDNVVVNGKIKEVLGQLPIRMTKQKYFELIKSSISLYKDGDMSSLESFLYMIKTCSMLYDADEMKDYPYLINLRKDFTNENYKEITKERYEELTKLLEISASYVNTRVDFYFGLQECINNLYVMLLSSPYVYMEGGYKLENLKEEMKYLILPQEMDKLREIISDINKQFLTGEFLPLGEEVEKKLSYTEGKQEILIEEVSKIEAYLPEIKGRYQGFIESLMLGPVFNSVLLSEKLLSSSLFIDLDKIDNKEKVDEEDIVKTQDEVLSELSRLFSENERAVTRAVMANTLSKLPVFFQDQAEIKEYIANSLEQCQDKAEKTACIRIIESFFDN
ncbi:hypothetical protein [Anaerocolumna xylanovorans]|uniref:Uncharacterized protein n=1 Tax=Anaerocolumna xylanovorans DSM 12503 TaxID=1121345 RepID=A0A1M7YCP9_9FIRM|nr:hypothetical protein [Anaerocolumna xylanovorans]SHO50346.1 hypothetical protein SAMN02745217_02717 [Anaerocolumna xylanovorans DSM 12503]